MFHSTSRYMKGGNPFDLLKHRRAHCLFPTISTAETMANHSAFVGDPPNTQDDYWIIRGMFRLLHMDAADEADGYTLAPVITSSQREEEQVTSILAGMILSVVLMTAATCARLGLRFFRTGLRWGWDDWMLIPAAVWICQNSSSF